MRLRLEGEVYEAFARIGRRLEGRYHARLESGTAVPLGDLSQSLDKLSSNIYRFNLAMIRMIQSGEVGLQLGDEEDRLPYSARLLWRWRLTQPRGKPTKKEQKP